MIWLFVLGWALAAGPGFAAPPPPASGTIAYTRDGNIWLHDLAAGHDQPLTGDGQNATPAWSPDGQWLTFVSRKNGNADLYRMHADGSALTRLTTDVHDDIRPTYAPDGTLFFVRVLHEWKGLDLDAPEPWGDPSTWGRYAIVRRGAGGAETVVYDPTPSTCFLPTGLSAHSATRLALSQSCQSGVSVLLLDLTAQPPTERKVDHGFHPEWDGGYCAPAPKEWVADYGRWAPGQALLAFLGDADCADPGVGDSRNGLYTLAVDQPTAGSTLIYGGPACCFGLPDWSPDAQWLVFTGWSLTGNPLTPDGLWMVPAHGGPARQITASGSAPAWRPTGGALPGMPATGGEVDWLPTALLLGAGGLLVGVLLRRRVRRA